MSHSSLFLVLVSTQCFASQQLHHWNYYGLLLPWAAQKNRLIGGRLKEDNEVPVKSLEAYCIPLAASVNLYSKIIHFWQLLFLIFCISDRTTSTRPNSSPVQIFICTQMHVGWGYIEIAPAGPIPFLPIYKGDVCVMGKGGCQCKDPPATEPVNSCGSSKRRRRQAKVAMMTMWQVPECTTCWWCHHGMAGTSLLGDIYSLASACMVCGGFSGASFFLLCRLTSVQTVRLTLTTLSSLCPNVLKWGGGGAVNSPI